MISDLICHWPRKEKVIISQDVKLVMILIRDDGSRELFKVRQLTDLRAVDGITLDGKVAFTYGGQTIVFGRSLNRLETEQVVNLIASDIFQSDKD